MNIHMPLLAADDSVVFTLRGMLDASKSIFFLLWLGNQTASCKVLNTDF